MNDKRKIGLDNKKSASGSQSFKALANWRSGTNLIPLFAPLNYYLPIPLYIRVLSY
ncbi:hypothetical protein [Thalassobacillus devorans]|uniref:hypothetical protein n=1 Tax=Thalassobacillus devorans TaxID=279813 RepID=UPI0015934361|nr:hypothetical protein [Thalassobacillus devorans]